MKAINLALDMKKFQEHSFGSTKCIRLKIGIHYGIVIAGVIGDHKPQFSLIGDTVNTTSRVCSTGEDGEINISEEAFNQVNLRDSLDFSPRRKDVTPNAAYPESG